jgi:hypothetical protein
MSRGTLFPICTIVGIVVVGIIIAIMIPMPITSPATALTLSSPAFSDGGLMPGIYTCNGQSVIPPLNIGGVPKRAVSLVLTLEDPDTAMGTFDHWVVFNMDPEMSSIEEGVEPKGVHGKGSSGDTAYVSPCPPSGVHRYIFNLYALDIELPLTEGATKAEVLDALKGHIVGMTKMTVKYGK